MFFFYKRIIRIILVLTGLAFSTHACTPKPPANLPSMEALITLTQSIDSHKIQSTRTPPLNGMAATSPPSVEETNRLPVTTQTTPEPDSLNESLSSTPTNTRIPQLTSDLLFLSQGILMRWDHVTDYIGTLAEGVVGYSVNANGKAIAMLRAKNVTANGVEQYKLDVLDFETKQITTLLDQIPRLYHMSISPDARWIIFTYEEKPGTIFALQTERAINMISSDQSERLPVELGQCEAGSDNTCLGMSWSPDSQALLWGDSRGIWIYTLANGDAQLVQSNNVTISDPQNVTNEIEVAFLSLDWSPAGRFALLTLEPTSSQVSWQTILDTRTGRLVQVPDSYETDDWESSVTWTNNGDLLVLHAADPASRRPPFVSIYRVFPTSNELLVSIRNFEFHGIQLPTKSSSTELLPVPYLKWPNLLDLRTLILGSITTEISNHPALLSVDLEFQKFNKLLELPVDTADILWSPDGQNALILGSNGKILFLALPGGALRDIRSVLTERAHDFFWLPPVPRF